MKAFLTIFLLISLQQVNGLDYSSLVSSFNGNTVKEMVNAYLGGNSQVTTAITNLASALMTKNRSEIIEEVQKDLNILSSEKILNGYSYSEDTKILTLGVLDVNALNSSMKGTLTPTLLDTVIRKLNETVISGQISAVPEGYDLGQINLNTVQTQIQSITQSPIRRPSNNIVFDKFIASANSDVLDPDNITAQDSGLKLDFPSPLVPLSITNGDKLSFREKLDVRSLFTLSFTFH